MVAHELATLNETREENSELKRTCESLRGRNAALQRDFTVSLDRNTILENTVQGTCLALDSLIKAMKVALPSDLVEQIIVRSKEISGAPAIDAKPNKVSRAFKFGRLSIPVKQ